MSTDHSAPPAVPDWHGMAWRSGLCAVAATTGWIFHGMGQSTASMACYLLAFVAGGWDLAIETWHEFRKFEFTTHFLMLLVVPATAALGGVGGGRSLAGVVFGFLGAGALCDGADAECD
jgi:Zn2+/Cd2+-exporting ATPase